MNSAFSDSVFLKRREIVEARNRPLKNQNGVRPDARTPSDGIANGSNQKQHDRCGEDAGHHHTSAVITASINYSVRRNQSLRETRLLCARPRSSAALVAGPTGAAAATVIVDFWTGRERVARLACGKNSVRNGEVRARDISNPVKRVMLLCNISLYGMSVQFRVSIRDISFKYNSKLISSYSKYF